LKKQRIWIVSEVFHPDETSTAYIMTKIAESLTYSAEVHVLCGPKGYGAIENYSTNELNGVIIHRLKAFNLDKNNIIFRLLRVTFLSLGMFFFCLIMVNKGDRLLLVTNPAFSIPLFGFLKKIKKFQFYILVHDVFPENLIAANILKSKTNLLYVFLKRIFNLSYSQANKLFVLGRDMAQIMKEKTNSITEIIIIENWADLDNIYPTSFINNPIIKEHNLQEKVVFLFAGNLGRLQGLNFLFDIISLINNDLIHFLFVGNGAMLSELKEIKNQKGLKNISFLGSLPRNQQSNFLNASHFGVVTLEEKVYGLGVPSKSYNILAAGKPIFFIGNQLSEIAQLISESSCGVSFGMNQKQEIINFFNNLNSINIFQYTKMGILGRKKAQEKYSKDAILLKFKNEIVNVYQ
jgi:hypothetical protein